MATVLNAILARKYEALYSVPASWRWWIAGAKAIVLRLPSPAASKMADASAWDCLLCSARRRVRRLDSRSMRRYHVRRRQIYDNSQIPSNKGEVNRHLGLNRFQAAFLFPSWLEGEAQLNSLLHTGQRNNIAVRATRLTFWMHELRVCNCSSFAGSWNSRLLVSSLIAAVRKTGEIHQWFIIQESNLCFSTLLRQKHINGARHFFAGCGLWGMLNCKSLFIRPFSTYMLN